MFGYLINPETGTVKTVEHNGDYRHIYDLIDARTFDVVDIDFDPDTNTRVSLYIDGEGLLDIKPDDLFFKHVGSVYPFKGKGLVLGCDENGETVSPAVSLPDLENSLTYMSLPEVREHARREGI
tara:strand:+ start:756 stop:1127 length:372 start_codon:yes stop_codon:yes gene_type:complete